MGVSIEKGATFLGVPLVKVRNVLKAWRHGHRDNLWRIAEPKAVELDPRSVIVLVEELRDRGLIGPEEQERGPPEDGLTEAGLALAGAAARPRTPKALATNILGRFLDACAAVNARDDLPFDVRRVWLFGSMIDPEKADVGDIDLVVEKGLPARYPDRQSALERFDELAEQMGAPQQSGLMAAFGASIFVERELLHGGRRHPLLSLGDAGELRDLACPCRLIFDAERGGRVTDTILHRHPDSNGRSNRIGDRRRMPKFTDGRQPLSPIPANLMTCKSVAYRTLQAVGPWPVDDFRYRLVQPQVAHISILAEGVTLPRCGANALSKRLRFLSCDGRHRTGLLLIETEMIDRQDWRQGYRRWPVVGAVIERSIRENKSVVSYRLDFAEADHLGHGIELEHMLAFEWWAHLIATADIERILRREQELQAEFEISAEISFSADRSVAGMLASMKADADHNLVGEVRARLAG